MRNTERMSGITVSSQRNTRGFIDTLLILMMISVVIFVIAVLALFAYTGNEPSTLVASVFAFVTAEAGICWQIHAKKQGMTITGAGDITSGLDIVCDINDTEEGGVG